MNNYISKKVLGLIVTIMISGLIFCVIGIIDVVKCAEYDKLDKDFNDYKVSDFKEGDIFKGDVSMVLDIIASSDDESVSYYLIVISNGDYEGYCVLETSYKQKEMEALCEQTWDYLVGDADKLGTPIPIMVEIAEAETDVIDWSKEWFENDENSNAISELCQYKMVEYNGSSDKSVIFIIIGAVIFAVGVVVNIIYRRKTLR